MEYKILTRSLKDSAANSKLKLLKEGEIFGVEKPGGEKRIHIGSMSDEKEWDRFFFPNGGQTFNVIVSKIDLIKYLLEAKDEFLNPVQSYRLNISEFYEGLYEQTLNIRQESFRICFEKNTDNLRYYLSRPSGNELSKNYKYVIDICLPIVTNYVFLRIKDENLYTFYLKPEFRPDLITDDKIRHDLPEDKPDFTGSLQQIFYGAPGTGKSHSIKGDANVKEAEKGNRVFRTTFHPDSDYSTFVGCYKPSMKSGDKIYSAEELSVKLKEIKNTGVPYPCHKFAAKYWRSLKDLDPNSIKHILLACGFTEAYGVKVSKGIAIGQEFLNKDEDGKIIYTFTPQAFTNAYVKAWNTTENVYLIIEEINRGNCAQIFGDLFQLLDRGDDGKSEYPIDADTDLGSYIAKELESSMRSDFPDGVKDGKKLVLPSNLYIWATMNTSDQSLFPIDSAFKRRWDWQYVPIHDGRKGWQIEADGKRYDWWQFVDAMNDKIGTATYSEDKKLGYFFCKAKDGVIDAETFVGKVVFYIWNDVFKDFAEEAGNLFKDVDGSMLSFNKFYTIGTDGKRMVVEPKIAILMQNLGVEPITTSNSTNDDEPEEDEDGNNPSSYNKNYDKFSVNGEGKWGKNRLPYECLKKYVEMNPGLNADEVLNNWKSLNVNVPHFVESKEEYESRTDNSKRSYYVKCGDTIIYVAQNGYGSNGKVYEFIAAINNANWGIKLAKVMA